MSTNQQIETELSHLPGRVWSPGEVFSFSPACGVHVELEVVASDSLSCAFRQLRVTNDSMPAEVEPLSDWAAEVCQRVTYLIEQLSVLEHDKHSLQWLIRSKTPTVRNGQMGYYEAVVSAPGTLTLRRFSRDQVTKVRRQSDIRVTYDVLQMLLQDTVESSQLTAV